MATPRSPTSPTLSQATTIALTPNPRLRRANAFVGSPKIASSPMTPMKAMKVSTASPSSAGHAKLPQTPKAKSPQTAKAKVGRKSQTKSVPMKVMKAMKAKVMKVTPPKTKKLKVPKSVKPASAMKKLVKLKKPASSTIPQTLTKKQKFDKTMSKIRHEWECLRDYNTSFNCLPPCGWTELLGTQSIAEMV